MFVLDKNNLFGGAAISLGAFAYLVILQKTQNSILAACVFYLGLSLILMYRQDLFTGMVLTKYGLPKKDYIIILFKTWIGNLIGSIITSILLFQLVQPDIFSLVSHKLILSPLQMIIGGLFCNMLVCCAVDNYRKNNSHLMSWFYITLFVVFGFNHIVADFTYFTIALLSGIYLEPAALVTSLICVTIGNFLGGIFVAKTLAREEN